MKLRRKTSEEITGFLDQGTDVTGELQFSGTLRIDGSFHGSISTSDILVIGEHAVVHADIKAGELEVHGRVFGNIEGQRRVEIFPTGRVRGDIRSPELIVNQGAAFDGRSTMVGDDATDSAATENQRLIGKGLEDTH
jgi:cytoskeletal protein CcmA (bactofilin family)